MKKTVFIKTLPTETQKEIKNALIRNGLDAAAIEEALNSRLCDLEETININDYIKGDK